MTPLARITQFHSFFLSCLLVETQRSAHRWPTANVDYILRPGMVVHMGNSTREAEAGKSSVQDLQDQPGFCSKSLSQKNRVWGAGVVAQVVECLPSKHSRS